MVVVEGRWVKVDGEARRAPAGASKTHPDDDEQADVQRGRLVVGLVEAGEGVEQRPEIGRWNLCCAE
mgnify:CR=1 FL=1